FCFYQKQFFLETERFLLVELQNLLLCFCFLHNLRKLQQGIYSYEKHIGWHSGDLFLSLSEELCRLKLPDKLNFRLQKRTNNLLPKSDFRLTKAPSGRFCFGKSKPCFWLICQCGSDFR